MPIQYKIDFNFPKFDRFTKEQLVVVSVMAMNESLEFVRNVLTGNSPSYQGLLKGSYVKTFQGTGIDLTGRIGTDISYGIPVEVGRLPGSFPPVVAIQMWVQDKFGSTRLSYVIARKIAVKGIPGIHMFEKSAADSYDAVQAIWNKWFNVIFK